MTIFLKMNYNKPIPSLLGITFICEIVYYLLGISVFITSAHSSISSLLVTLAVGQIVLLSVAYYTNLLIVVRVAYLSLSANELCGIISALVSPGFWENPFAMLRHLPIFIIFLCWRCFALWKWSLNSDKKMGERE